MNQRTAGLSVVELVLVLALLGILTTIGLVILPRHGMAMNQAERNLQSSIQFTRFEAIKRNATLEAVFAEGATEVVVRDPAAGGAGVRSFPLDPQASRVQVKSVSAGGVIAFNARGVATTQVTRSVVLGLSNTAEFDRTYAISGQGVVSR